MGYPLFNPLVILVKTCGTRLEELIERVSGFGDFEKFKKKHPCKYIQKYKSNEKVPNSNKYKFYVCSNALLPVTTAKLRYVIKHVAL